MNYDQTPVSYLENRYIRKDLWIDILTTYEFENFVALLLHQLFTVGLNIQAEQRFCIGWAHVKPPVAKVHRDAIGVIYGLGFFAKVLFQGAHLALDITHRGVNFATTETLVEWLENFGERLSLNRNKF